MITNEWIRIRIGFGNWKKKINSLRFGRRRASVIPFFSPWKYWIIWIISDAISMKLILLFWSVSIYYTQHGTWRCSHWNSCKRISHDLRSCDIIIYKNGFKSIGDTSIRDVQLIWLLTVYVFQRETFPIQLKWIDGLNLINQNEII